MKNIGLIIIVLLALGGCTQQVYYCYPRFTEVDPADNMRRKAQFLNYFESLRSCIPQSDCTDFRKQTFEKLDMIDFDSDTLIYCETIDYGDSLLFRGSIFKSNSGSFLHTELKNGKIINSRNKCVELLVYYLRKDDMQSFPTEDKSGKKTGASVLVAIRDKRNYYYNITYRNNVSLPIQNGLFDCELPKDTVPRISDVYKF